MRGDLPLDGPLAPAVRYRADLASVQELAAAAIAQAGATLWGDSAPELRAGRFEDPPRSFDPRAQQSSAASATWRLGLSTFVNARASMPLLLRAACSPTSTTRARQAAYRDRRR